MKETKKHKMVDYAKYGYLFIAPFFIVFAIFQLYPLLNTFWQSIIVTTKAGRHAVETTSYGLGNYVSYMIKDMTGWKAIGVTIVLWLCNFVPQILLSLLLAAWFTDAHNKLKAQGAYKVIMYMPNIITAATIAILFFNLFDTNGAANAIIRIFGLTQASDYAYTVTDASGAVVANGTIALQSFKLRLVEFFNSSALPSCIDAIKGYVGNNDYTITGVLTCYGNLGSGWASFIIISFIQFWMWYGNTMIVLIAGILGISPSLYEAAMVDGATARQQFFKITIPLLMPILQFTLVTSAIGGLQMYDIPYLFNDGGPIASLGGTTIESTTTAVMLIKNFLSGTSQNVARSSTYSVVLFVITLAVSMIFFFATKEKKNKY